MAQEVIAKVTPDMNQGIGYPGRSGRRPEASKKLKELWADPVWRADLLERRKATVSRGGRPRARIGMNKEQVQRFWRLAKFQAQLTMNKLEQAGVLDDADTQAKEALKHALTVMRSHATPIKDSLTAASLVLTYTKAKPAQKTELTVTKAEEWLEAVTADAKADESTDRSAQAPTE